MLISIAVNPLEATAAALVIIAVALVAWRSVWNFPTAIAAVAIYAVIFAEARLYSDMILQGFFLVANIYGWVGWSRVKAGAGRVVVGMMDGKARTRWAVGTVAAILLWGGAMHAFTDASYPWWDAGIAITSVVAQLLQARRRIESWWLWIAVDLASIPLYAVKNLPFTTGVYVILLALSILGLRDWRRAMRQGEAGA